jgi:hypothetical protein
VGFWTFRFIRGAWASVARFFGRPASHISLLVRVQVRATSMGSRGVLCVPCGHYLAGIVGWGAGAFGCKNSGHDSRMYGTVGFYAGMFRGYGMFEGLVSIAASSYFEGVATSGCCSVFVFDGPAFSGGAASAFATYMDTQLFYVHCSHTFDDGDDHFRLDSLGVYNRSVQSQPSSG